MIEDNRFISAAVVVVAVVGARFITSVVGAVIASVVVADSGVGSIVTSVVVVVMDVDAGIDVATLILAGVIGRSTGGVTSLCVTAMCLRACNCACN